MDDQCAHLVVSPNAVRARTPEGCEACLEHGGTWKDLWICLSCGYVGCGERSPGWHAYEHFRQTGHPVVGAYDPVGRWKWCFTDCLMLEY
jgi:uncharacterized UBP type Zn finger protein